MKKQILSLLCCVLAGIQCAQNTGQSTYDHAGTPAILSAGTHVNFSPGFIMAGYNPVVTAGNPNFYVDKVDPTGAFGAGCFSNGYSFDFGCPAPLAQLVDCHGVSIIESSTNEYALAAAFGSGSFDTGCLFAILDATGNVVTEVYLRFPMNSTGVTKPLITESTSNPGEYYVSGSFIYSGFNSIFAFKIDNAGTVLWNRHYDIPFTGRFEPRGIIEGNYNGPELAIAGIQSTASFDQMLFMLIDGATGNINLSINPASHIPNAFATSAYVNGLHCIALSTAHNGYVVGGMLAAPWTAPGTYPHLLVLNSTGGILASKSYIVNFWMAATATEIISVTERLSTYGTYEYYGLANSSKGMVVFKTYDNANISTQPGNTNNTFFYNTGNGPLSSACAISNCNDPTSPNYGIHVFGNSMAGASDFFLNQACFNGATANCPAPVNQEIFSMGNSSFAGWLNSGTITPTTEIELFPCSNHILNVSSITYAPVQPCSMATLPTAPYPGDQSRLAATTLTEAEKEATGLSLFPNPASDVVTIRFNLNKKSNVQLSLLNSLGQVIKVIESGNQTMGDYSTDLSLKNLNVESGIYFVSVKINGATYQEKIIYSKD